MSNYRKITVTAIAGGLCTAIGIAQEGWNTLSLSMSYFGLFMLFVG